MGSQGAVFNLVLRDERVDRLFTASDMLRARLNRIRAERAARGAEPLQPTFADVERTHVLYVRGGYRPYVAVASEYSKTQASGDGSAAVTNSGGSVEFAMNTFGHFTSDMLFHVRFSPVGTQTPILLETTGDPATASPRYRYCAYPGIRLFRRVAFLSAKTLIDDYLADDVVAWAKQFVGPEQQTSWDRCNGQQAAKEATYFNNNGFTGILTYSDGAQTPKFYQEPLEMFVPVHFTHCTDAANALLNDLIPNTQRTVTAELAPLSQLLFAYDQNGDPTPLPFDRLKVEITLYSNGLFVNPEIHDVFASRVGFSLYRVHRRQVVPLQVPEGDVQMTQLKYPAEYLMGGVRARENAASPDHWHLYGRARARPDAQKLLVPAMIWNATLAICQLVCREAVETSTLEPLAEEIGVRAHGTTLYHRAPLGFYNAYLTNRYQVRCNTVAPRDSSAFLIPFCLYPGAPEPSGYYNLSSGRELFVSYRASTVSSASQAELVVAMSALNFIMRRGDSVTLRYAL